MLTSPTALMREPQVIGVADNELDLDDSPATDNVRVYDESFQEGVVVTLRWKVASQPSPHTQVQTVPASPLTLRFTVPRQVLEASVGQVVNVDYGARSGTAEQDSNVVTFTVRAPVAPSSIPYVLEADSISATPTSATLDLRKPLTGVRVCVPAYDGMAIGDHVVLQWEGAVGAGTVSLAREVDQVTDLYFDLPYSAVAANIGRLVSLYFTVAKGEGTPQPSARHVLDITNPPIVGSAQWLSGTTAVYTCAVPGSTIEVPANLPVGSRIVLSSTVPPRSHATIQAYTCSSFGVNRAGSQPSQFRDNGSDIAATTVKGVGMRLWFNYPGDDGVFGWGTGIINGPATTGNSTGTTTARFEFIKTGPISPGTLPAGPLVEWHMGASRLMFAHFSLANALTFVEVTQLSAQACEPTLITAPDPTGAARPVS